MSNPPVPVSAGEVGHVDVDAEECAEGVLVFAPVEAAHGEGAVLVGEVAACGDHHVGEIVEEVGLGGGGRLLLFLGRHFAGVECVEDLLPLLGALDRGDLEGEFIHAELALLLLRSVAGDAVFFEKRPVFFGHDRARCVRGEGAGEAQGASTQEVRTIRRTDRICGSGEFEGERGYWVSGWALRISSAVKKVVRPG